ncbi:MAG: shikimate dehydrogenase [Bacteroidaceae bacterium]
MKDIYGLIGYPLKHSFSRSFFNEKFTNEEIHAEYVNFEIPTIKDFLEVTGTPNLKGLNVTIPYKEQVIPFLDHFDSSAGEVGAVNVIKIVRTKGHMELIGYNSDVIGFRDSIEPLLKPFMKRALILGTGGASKAVVYALKQLGVESTFVTREIEKRGQLKYEDLTQEIMAEHKIIVNTTPVGMYPNSETCPNIPYEYLTKKHLLFDLIYNPDQTLFMRKGAAQGAEVKNGLEMLLLQAFASWDIWNS